MQTLSKTFFEKTFRISRAFFYLLLFVYLFLFCYSSAIYISTQRECSKPTKRRGTTLLHCFFTSQVSFLIKACGITLRMCMDVYNAGGYTRYLSFEAIGNSSSDT